MGEFKKVFHAKRIFAMALAVVLTVTSAPVTAQAAPDENSGQETVVTGTEDHSAQGSEEMGGEDTQEPSGDVKEDSADSGQTDDAQQTPAEAETGEQEEGSGEGAEAGAQEKEPAAEDTESESGVQENGPDEAEEGEPETAEESVVVEEAQMQLMTSEDDIASGSYTEGESDISWVIDKDGKLTVEGTGELASAVEAPWYSHRNAIVSAEIKITGLTDARYMFHDCRNLTTVNLSGFDTSTVTNMGSMFLGCSGLTSLDLNGFDTSKVTNMASMFSGCYRLISLDLSGFSNSSVQNMESMFSGCSSLTSLDLSGFGTSNVETMESMFSGCSSLTSLDLSGFGTSSVQNMASMFSGCSSLTSLNLNGFGTSNVKTMESMFSGCSSLTSLNLSGFGTSNVETMESMFSGCSSLTNLDLSSFDTQKVLRMGSMFSGCSSLTSLDLSSFNTSNVKYMASMFNGCGKLESVDVSGFSTAYVFGMASMFEGCSSLTNLDLKGFDTSKVNNMARMFYGCSSLTSLDISGFDTSNVELGSTSSDGGMYGMFSGCSSLTSLDVSHFDTGKVRGVEYMFNDCSSLTSLDVSHFDTGKMTDMRGMFNGCSSLSSLDVSNFDLASNSYMSSMFRGCSSLTSLDLSNFNTSRVSYMDSMFEGCSSLTSLDLSSFNTSNVKYMAGMFKGCSSLVDLDVSSFDTSRVTITQSMFEGCSSLTSLDLSPFDFSKVELGCGDFMFRDCSSLETIRTPRNVIKGMTLDGDTTCKWYDRDGNEYTIMPVKLTESIRIAKGRLAYVSEITATKAKTDYNCGDTLHVDDLEVTYYNDKGVSARVAEGYTTNADRVDMLTPGKKILEVSYNGMTAEVEITVGAVETVYTVAFEGTGKDDITAETPKEVKEGADYTFTLVKAEGHSYTIEIKMGGTPVTPVVDATGSIYSIPNVTANLVITINKTADQSPEPVEKFYTVTFEGTGRDDVAVGTPKEVKEGENYTFTLTKAEGYTYTVTAVMGTQSVTPSVDTTGTLYTISGVTADLVITISRTADQTPDVPDLPEEDRTGLKIKFVHEEDAECVYTGKAVQPEIRVYYNGKILTPGTDYTVKYANNIKVGTATVTITGKGNFSKANSKTTFRIVAKNMADSDLILSGVGKDADGKETVSFADAARLAPVLYYNNTKLSNKDFVVKNASDAEITNKKLTISDDNTVIRIDGKAGGNFTGSREVRLRIVDKKNLKKFTVTVDKNRINTFSYDGRPHYIHETEGALTVTAKDEGKTVMEYGKDYAIVYQGDLVSAGTKKFTVVGMGLYTGSVSKSYTVKPAMEETLTIRYDGSAVSGNKINGSFTFASAGVTIGDRLAIAGSDGKVLREGRDYKLAYSGNKKANQNAKCTVSFLGNYKGHAKVNVSYEIGKADLGGTDVVIADQLYKDKPGIYKSVPYVIEDRAGANTLLKASNYKVTYYTEDPTNNAGAAQMKGANKVGDGATVWVKLEAKGNNYSGTKIVSYKVRSAQDLSKARITFQDAEGSAVKSAAYTGSQITGEQIKAVVNGTLAENEKDIEVIYVDNVRKGKATVIVKAAGTDGCKYVGSKKVTFSIVARNLN